MRRSDFMRIVIYYNDGTNEEYFGDMSISREGIFNIYPACGRGVPPTGIPLTSIKKYTIDR